MMGLAEKYTQTGARNIPGKKCQVVEWGRLRLYMGKNKWGRDWENIKKVYGVGCQWRLYKSTRFDQIEKFSQLNKSERSKYTRFVIECFDDVVSHYASHGWNDPIYFCALALDNGCEVHLNFSDDKKAKDLFLEIVECMNEIATENEEETVMDYE